LTLAAWCVWRPVETFPLTAVVVAGVILSLTVWGWRRTPRAASAWLQAGAIGVVLLISGLSGWDPASAIGDIALVSAVIALMWLASRQTPPESWPAIFALVIAALTLWGIWQVGWGMERAAAGLTVLPEPMREAAAERLNAGRAFASMLLPSHLAVLLATALPLLIVRLRKHRSAALWAAGSILCVVGLFLTRSPVGAALALGACLTLALRRRRGPLLLIALFLVVVLAAAIIGRGDVVHLTPVKLRIDNWQSAVWVWSQTPAAGVGIGGFAQAAQAIPFGVGNRPRHAHCLPLEWLAELGPVGLLLFSFGVLALWRLLCNLWSERPELAVALAVIPVHNLLDFSLYSTGIALAWAVLVGWGLAYRSPPREVVADGSRGRIVVVSVVTLALAASILHATSIEVEDSSAVADSPVEMFEGAMQARRLAPWRVEPLGLLAIAAMKTGMPEQMTTARYELDRGGWLRSRSAALAGLRARLALNLGQAPTALTEAWTAVAEQPSNETHVENFEELLDRLEPGGIDDGS
jgi:hypothetical protein